MTFREIYFFLNRISTAVTNPEAKKNKMQDSLENSPKIGIFIPELKGIKKNPVKIKKRLKLILYFLNINFNYIFLLIVF